jgi:hypothetical protein
MSTVQPRLLSLWTYTHRESIEPDKKLLVALAGNQQSWHLHVRHSGPSGSCLLVLARSTRVMCLLHSGVHNISVEPVEVHVAACLRNSIVAIDVLFFWQLS